MRSKMPESTPENLGISLLDLWANIACTDLNKRFKDYLDYPDTYRLKEASCKDGKVKVKINTPDGVRTFILTAEEK